VHSSGYPALIERLDHWQTEALAAVFYVDIHDFRAINRLATPMGADRLLQDIDAALRKWAGPDGVAGRLWADEFLAVRAIDHAQTAAELAMDLRARLVSLEYQGAGGRGQLSVSIGVVCARQPDNWAELVEFANDACAIAKQRGANQICFHGSGVGGRISPIRTEAVSEFRTLRDAGQMELCPQPIMDITQREQQIAKAEFLLRVNRDGKLQPPPCGMIEGLERHGVVTELDQFSSRWLLEWLENHGDIVDRLDGVSINLSAKSFVDGVFMRRLFDDVRHARIASKKLVFEITETAAIQHLNVAAETIADFKTLGCRFSLDDFGSGLCSFGYLNALPVDEVKVDGSFIRELAQSDVTEKIVRAIYQIARATNKTTVAEFVDDTRKLAVLRDIGFDYAQGWLFYPAISAERFVQLLRESMAA